MNLKQLYGSRYRVTLDQSYKHETEQGKKDNEWWYHEIKGRYGYIYPYALNQAAVTFTSNTIANKFNKRAWKTIQNGENERTRLVPKEDLNEVLEAIWPRRKRQVTEEMREKGRKLAEKYQFGRKLAVTQVDENGHKGT